MRSPGASVDLIWMCGSCGHGFKVILYRWAKCGSDLGIINDQMKVHCIGRRYRSISGDFFDLQKG